MNFLKKVIGLGMAVVMAFGGFATDAVLFYEKHLNIFVDINCWYSNDYYKLCADHFGFNFYNLKKKTLINDCEMIVDLKKIFNIKNCEKVDDSKLNYYIENYIDNSVRLLYFFRYHEYEAPDRTIWKIAQYRPLYAYKKEMVIFDHYIKNFGSILKYNLIGRMYNFNLY